MDDQDKNTARVKRGEITEDFLARWQGYPDGDLIDRLNDSNPQIRTAAAKVLGKRRCVKAVPGLCLRLSGEKALYSRIAVSNALGEIGMPALPELIKYIGRIGKNQYHDLPSVIFKKWDYPLPRDIVVRTVIKVGQPALKTLNDQLNTGDERLIREVIDAIGYISFYTPDQSSFVNLRALLETYRNNQMIVWKIIRALQAFPNDQATDILAAYLFDGAVAQHRWEAARSLGQIATGNEERLLRAGLLDQHPLVRKMAELALQRIQKK